MISLGMQPLTRALGSSKAEAAQALETALSISMEIPEEDIRNFIIRGITLKISLAAFSVMALERMIWETAFLEKGQEMPVPENGRERTHRLRSR